MGICPAYANSVHPDQLATPEANWSGSALFVTKYENLYQLLRARRNEKLELVFVKHYAPNCLTLTLLDSNIACPWR